MTQEAPTLYPEPIEAHSPPGKGRHGYYRRIDDGGPASGWIVIAATTPSNRADYEYKGFTYLARYGEFTNGSAQPRAAAKERDARGNPWNPALEPWRLIFQLDGAKEFPISQIIEYRWHIRPPYKEVAFPQLKDVNVVNYGCPECDRVFSSTNEREAAIQLRSHLTSGTNSAHSYTPADLRSLGKEWDIDFDSERAGRRQVKLETEDALPIEGEQTEALDLTPTNKYRCANCGLEPTGQRPWLVLRNHKCNGESGP